MNKIFSIMRYHVALGEGMGAPRELAQQAVVREEATCTTMVYQMGHLWHFMCVCFNLLAKLWCIRFVCK